MTVWCSHCLLYRLFDCVTVWFRNSTIAGRCPGPQEQGGPGPPPFCGSKTRIKKMIWIGFFVPCENRSYTDAGISCTDARKSRFHSSNFGNFLGGGPSDPPKPGGVNPRDPSKMMAWSPSYRTSATDLKIVRHLYEKPSLRASLKVHKFHEVYPWRLSLKTWKCQIKCRPNVFSFNRMIQKKTDLKLADKRPNWQRCFCATARGEKYVSSPR